MTATEKDRASLLERLRKLKAMADGAADVGNAEEAAAFAAKVQELMLKHKVEMTDVEMEALREVDLIEAGLFDPAAHGIPAKRKRMFWQEQLAMLVARANFCSVTMFHASNRLTFIGRESDRKVAVYVYVTLSRGGSKAKKAAYNAARRAGLDTHGFDRSFYVGYVLAIRERYDRERAAFEAGLQKEGRGSALVRLSTAQAEVEAWIKANMKLRYTRGPGAPQQHSDVGAAAGAAAGRRANLRGNAVGAPDPREKHLGPATKLLTKGG